MKKMYKNLTILCCMALLCVSNGVFAQDACADATALVLDAAPVTGDNTGAIDENDLGVENEGACWLTDGDDGDVWFSIDGIDGQIDVQTFEGTNDDTQIAVYDACGGTQVACNDDFGTSLMSFVTFCAEAGTTYFIEVEGWDGTVGDFTISAVTSAADAPGYCSDPTADNFDDAPSVCAVENNDLCLFPLANDTCAEAQAMNIGSTVTGSNEGATPTSTAQGNAVAPDVWFSFVGDGSLVDIYTTLGQGLTDSYLVLYDECGGTVLAFNDDFDGLQSRINGICAADGETYIVEVQSFSGFTTTGAFSLTVEGSATPATTYCSDPGADQFEEFPEDCWVEDNTTCTFCAPINDVCLGAFPVAIDGTTFPGRNECAQPDDASCEFGDALGVWYTFNTGANNAIELTLAPAAAPLDSAAVGVEVAVFSGDCDGLTELFCANGDQDATAIAGLDINTNYFILVWTDAVLDQGEFDLSVVAGSAGCTDPTACNFDGSATIEIDCDFSCIGCTDEAAFNFDAEASVSCEDCCAFNDECVDAQEMTIGDSVIGTNGGATVSLPNVQGSAAAPDVYFSFVGDGSLVDISTTLGIGLTDSYLVLYDECGGNVLAFNDDFGGFQSAINGFCAADGETYIVEVQSFSGFTITGSFTLTIAASATAPTEYCGNPLATNFNAEPGDCDVENEELCDFMGCTDEAACNFDGLSEDDGGLLTDDGSCCLGNCATISLTDAFGDGWNGAIYTLTNIDTDEVVSTGGLTGTQNGGDFVVYDECLADGCLNLTITAGGFPSEIGFTIETQDGILYQTTDVLNDDDFAATDLIVDQVITFGDVSCPVAGCTDETALNYNPNATLDCNGTIDGTDLTCCTYPAANNDCDGALPITAGNTENFDVTFATNSGLDCNGPVGPGDGDLWYVYEATCDNDITIAALQGFGAGSVGIYTGECGELTEVGCFGPLNGAANALVTVTAGTTYYLKVGINPANVFLGTEGSVTITEGVCEGCTYDAATNYNPVAVLDNGTCEFPNSCTCPGDFNNDGNVSVVDLSGFLGAFGFPCAN